MEGIQLLGTPSTNLKRSGLLICDQNIGTSGNEIRKPPSAKKFAIQRMASLFSLGTNRSTKAPRSGVKRMMDNMWFCMKDQLLASSFRLLARSQERAARSCISVIHVIENETYQSRGHDQGIPLDQAPFEQARGIRKHARQDGGTVDADAVDDPFIPPTGNGCRETRNPTYVVDGCVNHVGVNP